VDVKLPHIMTVEEVATYLRIPRSSVYKLAQRGKIPCQKVGRHWRFRRESVDRWLDRGQSPEGTLRSPRFSGPETAEHGE
jgi:excisionase family DNA binding protein